MSDVTEELWWRDEDAEYIRHRSSRYPGATDLEPAWTLGHAGFVITIIATGGARAGVTAWKSSGADLRDYEGQG